MNDGVQENFNKIVLEGFWRTMVWPLLGMCYQKINRITFINISKLVPNKIGYKRRAKLKWVALLGRTELDNLQ